MRTLEPSIIINSALILILMLIICTVNIYINIRHKLSLFTIFIHIISFFMLSSLFCLMMDIVILGLPLENLYRTASLVFLALGGLSLAISALLITIMVRKRSTYLGLTPNLEAVFSGTGDLALVVDYRGFIYQVNHPEKLNLICKNPATLQEILLTLKERSKVAWPFPDNIDDLNGAMQCEVTLQQHGLHFILSISPIISDNFKIGFTVLFEDISVIRQSELKLQNQNEFLIGANEKLASYVKIIGSLESENERLRILRQLQSTLIEKIEETASIIRVIHENSFVNNPYKRDLKDVANMLRNVYKDVRKSVGQIAGKE